MSNADQVGGNMSSKVTAALAGVLTLAMYSGLGMAAA
ncbi:hypothetical protein C8R32_11642, partial [Nitrosospira sp. Nsp5]